MNVRTRVAAAATAFLLAFSVLAAAPSTAAVSAESAAAGAVKTADLTKFSPGGIISDAVFFDRGTMTEAQIQSFLEAKVPKCQTGYTCLKDWYDTSRTTTTDAMCGAYSGGVRERASRIIYKVAQACGINPQVILVTLQKEQGLVTHTWPSDWRYTIAMGQGCPDTAACDTRYYGFFNQVYGAAWQMKRYANPPGTSQFFTWYAPGNTWNILYNPNKGCGTSPVYVQNQATANLYYYTPYQPNAAALRAGYGEGDGCSAYGNRNFFNYFTDWFGSTIVPVDACAQPPAGEVAAAGGEYAVNASTLNLRSAPSTSCDEGRRALSAGAVVTRVATWGEWFKVRFESDEYWLHSDYVAPAPTAAYSTARLAGSSRYDTAVEVSKVAYPAGARTVFVASGEEFPDALAAGAAAGHVGGALLLTEPASLRASVTQELKRLAPSRVILIGGEGRIAAKVASDVAAAVPGVTVERIAGIDRYETSRLIAARFFAGSTAAYLATGDKFPDAVAAAALGGAFARPVLLIDGAAATVDDATRSTMSGVGVTRAVIAGSVETVSASIGDSLRAAGFAVERHGGRDRYDTARQLAAAVYPSGASGALVATGVDFPDALTGSVLGARTKSPLFTTPQSCLVGATKDWMIRSGVTKMTLLGGVPSLAETVASSVRC